ncbi:MAG: hypothetical protein MJE77_26225 [Proteobacteria bacterium]|nr:hypothetical protein [Pseudomonadota bacterium]
MSDFIDRAVALALGTAPLVRSVIGPPVTGPGTSAEWPVEVDVSIAAGAAPGQPEDPDANTGDWPLSDHADQRETPRSPGEPDWNDADSAMRGPDMAVEPAAQKERRMAPSRPARHGRHSSRKRMAPDTGVEPGPDERRVTDARQPHDRPNDSRQPHDPPKPAQKQPARGKSTQPEPPRLSHDQWAQPELALQQPEPEFRQVEPEFRQPEPQFRLPPRTTRSRLEPNPSQVPYKPRTSGSSDRASASNAPRANTLHRAVDGGPVRIASLTAKDAQIPARRPDSRHPEVAELPPAIGNLARPTESGQNREHSVPIRVSIGRIEVHAPQPTPAPAPAPALPSPSAPPQPAERTAIKLDEYLARREGRR